jgi:lysophospholipase
LSASATFGAKIAGQKEANMLIVSFVRAISLLPIKMLRDIIYRLNCTEVILHFRRSLVFYAVLFLFAVLGRAAYAFAEEPKGRVTDDGQLLGEQRFQAPAGWRWEYFTNHDSARIRYGFIRSPNSTATIVLVTGLTDTGETYFETVQDFMRRGYDLWLMDWRGQGGSDRYLAEREKTHSLGTNHDEADLAQFISLVLKEKPTRPLVLMAHSFGGLIALRYLHDHPSEVDLAVLGAPALSLLDKSPTWVSRPVIAAMVGLGFGKAYAKGQGDWDHSETHFTDPLLQSHDLERVRLQPAWFKANPELRAGGPTWAFVREFQRTGFLVTKRKYLKEIQTPILIGSALDDKIADPALHKRVCSVLPHATLFTIPDARHCVFHESDQFRDPWLKAIYQFIDCRTRIGQR